MDALTMRLRRCDRCAAPAKFQVLLNASGQDLLFCLTHVNVHSDTLLERFVVLPYAEESDG